jgi:hypothetical protein
VDSLIGGPSLNWFLASNIDLISRRKPTERIN